MGRKLAVEAIGTFFLVFTIGMAVLEPSAGPLGAFAIAAVLMAMIYAMIVLGITGGGPLTVLTLDVSKVIAVEFAFTFALAYVVLNVATARGVEGNSYFGGAIGLTVLAGAYAVGPISGGAFNPAVSLGILLFGVIAGADIWVFLLPQLLAGALAGVLFNVLDLGNDKPTTATPAEQASLTQQGQPAP
jgi:aquaporin Z